MENSQRSARHCAPAPGAPAVGLGAAVASAALAAGSAHAADPKSELPADLARLLNQLPTDDWPKAQQTLQQLLDRGPEAIARVAEAAGEEFGDPKGVKPKYALHGLVHYACRPGAAGERRLVAQTLAGLLGTDHSDEWKAFICRQLQFCGSENEVPALAPLLESERLCEPATQALCAIRGRRAADALRAALPKATGKRRTTLINALGWFGESSAAAEVRKDVAAEDADRRMVAWYALGEMADAESVDALMKAAGGPASFDRNQATDALMRLARGLAADDKAAEAEKICRRLIEMRSGPEEVHQRCAALECLGAAVGVRAMDDMLGALGAKDVRLRHAAARIAVDLAESWLAEHPREAEKLLKQAVEATIEEAVHVRARELLMQRA